MKESVTQQHEYGCGAACLAFVLDQSYESAVDSLGSSQARTNGYLCRDLARLLNSQGNPYEYRYLKPRLKARIYQDNTVVFIERSKRYPAGHYLVRYRGLWMDPWINFPHDRDISRAESGFKRKLPGRPIYALFTGLL